MTLVLDLPPDVEYRLKEEAARHGQPEAECALHLLDQHLPTHRHPLSLIIDQWDEEDATDDPVELEARQREWEEFKEAINKHHESDRIIYP